MSAKDEKAAPANKLDTMKRAVHDFLHEKNAFTSVFEMVEKYTKIQREYFFLGLIAVLVLYLMVGYGAGLVVNLLGFVYPAYKSCKAIDSVEKDDDTQWLTYWVVYAAFGILEYFTDILLSWMPFYFLAKCGFLIWCMLPMANSGSMVIYHRLIKPFVKKNEGTIEQIIDEGTQLTKDAVAKGVSAARDVASKVDPAVAMQAMQQVQQLADKTAAEKKDE